MSVEAITWALSQKVERSSTKFVLVAMANCADGRDWLCWPSTEYLAEATSQDRKTVLENVRRLREMGLIVDTGERRGATKQVPVYRINKDANRTENGTVEHTQKRNSSETGTVPFFPGNSTVFPVEQSRFSAETVPKTGHGTVKEPSKEPSGNRHKSAGAPEALIPDVTPEVAADWLRLRKAKRAPVTATAMDGLRREAEKAGMTLQAVLELCCQRGWSGFRADWASAQPQPQRATAAPAAVVDVAARNAEAKRLLGFGRNHEEVFDA